MHFVLGILSKTVGVLGLSVVLIPFILTSAFIVLKMNIFLKAVFTGKDSFFFNNVGDFSWFFNLLVYLFPFNSSNLSKADEKSSDKKILLIAIFIVLQSMMVMGFYLSYHFEKFREAKKSFLDLVSKKSKEETREGENKAH